MLCSHSEILELVLKYIRQKVLKYLFLNYLSNIVQLCLRMQYEIVVYVFAFFLIRSELLPFI